jgi:hypothetical protein
LSISKFKDWLGHRPGGRTANRKLPKGGSGTAPPRSTAALLEITSPAELHVLRSALEQYGQRNPPVVPNHSLFGSAVSLLQSRLAKLEIEELPKR